MSGTRAIDLLITYRIIKLLTTPFEKQDAYRLGIIDKNGKVLRKTKELKTGKESCCTYCMTTLRYHW